MKQVGILFLVAFALIGCGGRAEATPTPTKTPAAAAELPTATPTAVFAPTATPAPQTESPTPTPVAIEPGGTWDDVPHIEYGQPVSLDRGGVVVEVGGMRLYDFATALDVIPGMREDVEGSYADTFEGVTLLGSIYVTATNTTDQKMSVYPNQGTVVIGNEQVSVDLFLSDSVGGDFFPGVVKNGAVAFMLKRLTWADVSSGVNATYEVGSPHPSDTFLSDFDDYLFQFTLSP